MTGEADEGAEGFETRAKALEQRLRDVEVEAERRVRLVELKAEAMRAGIIDIDGLRLLDTASLEQDSDDVASVISRLKRNKPWMFQTSSSSSAAEAPQAAASKRKLATDMSLDEWRAARAEILRRK